MKHAHQIIAFIRVSLWAQPFNVQHLIGLLSKLALRVRCPHFEWDLGVPVYCVLFLLLVDE